jgi:hypothetical protein
MTVAEAAIAAHLAASGLGTVGTSIFTNYKPPNPDNLLVVNGYAGSPPDRTHDGSGNSHPGIQVWCRDTSAATCRTRIESVFNLLDGSGNFTVSGVYFLELNAVSSPVPLGKDENGRTEFSQNFQTTVRR